MTSPAYRWRRLTDEERQTVLTHRLQRGHPTHSPHHIDSGDRHYHITAACFDHQPVIGATPDRMTRFAEDWLAAIDEHSTQVSAWVVLPNHYHALVKTDAVLDLLKSLGRLHGKTSFLWNGEDNLRGRQVWCKAAETVIKSDGHYHATVNYIHHNPVKHGYVQRWTEWPWSSASNYLATTGHEEASRRWKAHSINEYGNGWDDADL